MKAETILNVTTSQYQPGEFGYWWIVTKGKTDIAGQVYKGDIDCSNNDLTSLKGCPAEVHGDFRCYNNRLKSLYGIPLQHRYNLLPSSQRLSLPVNFLPTDQ